MTEYMEGVYDEQRKQLHDFKNHMSCIQGLLKNHAYVEANDYLRNMNENWIDEVDYINTNHVIANSVLNQKYKQARKKGIAMILSVNDLQGMFSANWRYIAAGSIISIIPIIIFFLCMQKYFVSGNNEGAIKG